MGFFGKGSLSRSEPSWLEREKKRRGLMGENTSEEVTGMRRVERREFKLERARKEKEAIAEQLRAEGKLVDGPATDKGPSALDDASSRSLNEEKSASGSPPAQEQRTGSTTPAGNGSLVNDSEKTVMNRTKSVRFAPMVEVAEVKDSTEIEDEEHLQLSSEDAFFLAYGLGVLEVYDDTRNTILKPQSLLALLRQHSYFPPQDPSAMPEPDDRFMISYVAYHHFRSLGWVVRSGVKFGVDLLLYNRGPVFSHAEFAINLLPSYSHPYWKETEERRKQVAAKLNHTWWWLHCINRVQAQVKKSLILCFVEIPPPSTENKPDEQDIGELLKSYEVRELAVKRWVPNRSRD
ncbi:tRNA-splicing endonuclease subunit Sen2 [Arthroderma uncinatum]|uniref:tRNA-splicing endonuclease subunit Sen2 n=1 Tax=Arthroderma uncinatum TaxID=74035 RepID=UPI00144A9777|nr:tRNA-splicing endonuclease subunit Sen2 [Arthroderma uncinatum]KAF3479771.1 tRNA-splicing endonuclease subunit Sen2 [Arthroderma uncinatum]